MAQTEQRFIRTYIQSGISGSMQIWVDQETGVNYLYRTAGNGGGLTPLLKPDGTPVVTPPGQED